MSADWIVWSMLVVSYVCLGITWVLIIKIKALHRRACRVYDASASAEQAPTT